MYIAYSLANVPENLNLIFQIVEAALRIYKVRMCIRTGGE